MDRRQSLLSNKTPGIIKSQLNFNYNFHCYYFYSPAQAQSRQSVFLPELPVSGGKRSKFAATKRKETRQSVLAGSWLKPWTTKNVSRRVLSQFSCYYATELRERNHYSLLFAWDVLSAKHAHAHESTRKYWRYVQGYLERMIQKSKGNLVFSDSNYDTPYDIEREREMCDKRPHCPTSSMSSQKFQTE